MGIFFDKHPGEFHLPFFFSTLDFLNLIHYDFNLPVFFQGWKNTGGVGWLVAWLFG